MRYARAMRQTRIALSTECVRATRPSSISETEQILEDALRAPSIVSGRIVREAFHVRVRQRSLSRDRATSADLGPIPLESDLRSKVQIHAVPCDGIYTMEQSSPTGRWTLRARQDDQEGSSDARDKSCVVLEVWDTCAVVCEVRVPRKVHGAIVSDGWYESCAWDEEGMRVAYVAQAPEKEKVKLGQSKTDPSKPEGEGQASDFETGGWSARGEWEEDWGEAYTGDRPPRLFVLDIKKRRTDPIPSRNQEVSMGQAVWTPDKTGIVLVQFSHVPSNFPSAVARLGSIYCTRPSQLCHISWPPSIDDMPMPLTDEAEAAIMPRFTPDGDALVYLSRAAALKSGTHQGTVELVRRGWPHTVQREVLVPVIYEPQMGQLPGLYTEKLNPSPWIAKGKALLITTIWRSGTAIVAVDPLGSMQPCCISSTDAHHGSWTLLDATDNYVIASRSSPVLPASLMIARVPTDPLDSTAWKWEPVELFTHIISENLCSTLKRLRYQFVDVQPRMTVDSRECAGANSPFEAIMLEPAEMEGLPGPTILCPHGGPHSSFVCNWSPEHAFLCSLGYKVILVNYRGSLGFGEAALQSLPGKVGLQDVQDVLDALDRFIESGAVDSSRVAVMGGSHGGFLTGHLLGQAPERFCCGILRNPVCNIAAMVNVTDIPDWCHVEVFGVLGKEMYSEAPKPNVLEKMYNHSPIAHVDKVVAPTLFHLGAKDRRVPYSDALQMIRALRARGKKAHAILFPDDRHPLDKPRTEYERCMSTAEFLRENIPPL